MTNDGLLNELADREGFDDPYEMLEEYALDGTVPGICPHCFSVHYYEPDQDAGWCDECEAGTVISCLILAGIF